MRPVICNKRKGILPKTVLLHHNNTCPHEVAATVEAMKQLWFVRLLHPPYSLDLASCDYDIFGSFKEAVQGHRSTFDDEVKEVADLDLGATEKFCIKRMKKLEE